jgi:hypothetical protein
MGSHRASQGRHSGKKHHGRQDEPFLLPRAGASFPLFAKRERQLPDTRRFITLAA